jgi:site-specific DNA recombinase
MANNKLSKIIKLKPFMKIAIDENVPVDENGNYLINVGYLRVSTDTQAEKGYGLDIQEEGIVNFAKYNKIENLLLFIDDGITGTTMNRPALNSIVKFIEDFNNEKSKIRINSMIIHRIDRLGRTLLGTLQFIQDYIVAAEDSKDSEKNKNKEDINFFSVQENYWRIAEDDPQSKFLLMLFATLAEYDRNLIVEKLKKGRLQRLETGKWMGGGIKPYGYKYNSEKGTLEIIPQEAEKVREVFRLYIEEKKPPAQISDLLGFKGERIVIQILKRKTYTGSMIYNGVEYKGNHKPIIELETWEEAQEQMALRSVIRAESNYLLTGLLVCGECGAKLRYQKWSKTTGECKLVCYSQQKSKPHLVKDENCDNEKYWQSDIEKAVIDELFKLSYLGDQSKKKTATTLNPIEVLQNSLKEQEAKLKKYYNHSEGADEDDIIFDLIRETRLKIKSLKSQIASEKEQQKIKQKVKRAKIILGSLEDTWGKMSQKEKQAVCQELIEKVIVYKNGTIDIHLRLRSYLAKKENSETLN